MRWRKRMIQTAAMHAERHLHIYCPFRKRNALWRRVVDMGVAIIFIPVASPIYSLSTMLSEQVGVVLICVQRLLLRVLFLEKFLMKILKVW